jgi:hypothetical protein
VPKTEEKAFIHFCTNLAFIVNTIMGFLFLFLFLKFKVGALSRNVKWREIIFIHQ